MNKTQNNYSSFEAKPQPPSVISRLIHLLILLGPVPNVFPQRSWRTCPQRSWWTSHLTLYASRLTLHASRLTLYALPFTLLFSCSGNRNDLNTLTAPDHFPTPPVYPDNPITEEKVELGKKLFFDARLSGDFGVSCASCHIPQYAFSDTVAKSFGFHDRPGHRNSPSLVNIAYKPYMFKDGGVHRLETQAHGPLENFEEMNISNKRLRDRLLQDDDYVQRFARVFDEAPTKRGVQYALAAYQRTLIFGSSAYDRYLSKGDSALTKSQQRGMALFQSDSLRCNRCHTGVLLTNFTFQNNGLKSHYADSGRAKLTLNPSDAGKFSVPSLRNAAVTAPYMYDGSIKTLEGVVDHYAGGGSDHQNKSRHIKGFQLTTRQKNDLINFLHSLTDEAFLQHD